MWLFTRVWCWSRGNVSICMPNMLFAIKRGSMSNGTTTNISTYIRTGNSLNYNHLGSRVNIWQRNHCKTSLSPANIKNTIYFRSPQMPVSRNLSTVTPVQKDVILFEHDRTRFFRLLAVFCGGQLLFWTYLAHFAYTGLKDTRGSVPPARTVATTGLAGLWSFEMNLGSNVWRYGFTSACLAIGAGIVGLGVLFCGRSVSQVILHKGGRMVTLSTQSPLGPDQGRRITIPLSQVACYAHRQESPSFVPLRVKGHKFYFLLDKEGTLNNPKLFDVTVGAYRPF